MRILHFEAGAHLYGGAQQVLLLVEGLQRRGLENILVVPTGTPLEDEARARGLPVHPLYVAGDLDPLLPIRLRHLLLSVGPDLVHLHSRRGADTLGGIAARWAGLPTVLSRRVDNPELGWLVGPKYRLYDAVVAISRAIQEALVSQGVPAAKVRCVRSAVDPAPFVGPCDREAFLREFELESSVRVVGMAAQFIPRKGHEVLLQAVPRILAEQPDSRFLLFGQGPLRETLRLRVRKEGLDQHVLFPGFRKDLPRLLPCLDVLAHPALKEGLGIILLQASASGVPIVAARAGGIPEAVREGENGLLVEPADAPSLAAAVARILSDPGEAESLAAGGRELIRREFSVDRMVEGNLQVYREVLGSAG